MTKRYKIDYTADVWMSVEIEANSKEEVEKLFGESKHYDQGYHPEEMGMENLKVDQIKEIK